jgi:aflatoxin B1 aldehyde reductase
MAPPQPDLTTPADQINVLYSHRPDPQTPLPEQAAALSTHFHAGHFAELGVSNWSQSTLAAYLAHADRVPGTVRPTVAQYQYNLLVRHAETAFVPFLREHGIRLVAFSPMAGGVLSGQLRRDGGGSTAAAGEGQQQEQQETQNSRSRFAPGNPFGAGYRRWYDHDGMHAAVERLAKLCAEFAVPMPEASLRWLAYHSALREGDAILIGASRVAQIEDAVRAVAAGPLPEGMVKGMDAVWEPCREDAQALVTF